jgi:LmbE family N-acetylglucosaminyl deacetylase
MPAHPLRILFIGAHPDDCEMKAGGTTALYRALGHHVKFVSVTNGGAGHHRHLPGQLTAIRKAEADAVAVLLGIDYQVLDYRDGQLEPTIAARSAMIALIRRYQPDLVVTHRPNDYHPDHRATSTLVCDAAYMVIVPHIVPEVPALRVNPVIAYFSDSFERPYPFSPLVAIDVEPVLERIVDQLECHKSQFHEWLPYTICREDRVPHDAAGRREFVRQFYLDWVSPLADRHRQLVMQTYGPERGRKIRYIEAFEPCEYGSPLNSENVKELFPMLP